MPASVALIMSTRRPAFLRQCLRSYISSCTFTPPVVRLSASTNSQYRSLSTTAVLNKAAMASLQRSAFLEAIQRHDPESTAVVHSLSGRAFKYGYLLQDISKAKAELLRATGQTETSIRGERIAFLVDNSYDYVVTLLAIIASNAVAVPLATSFPTIELRYVMNNSGALALLASGKFAYLANDVLREGMDKKPHGVLIEKTIERVRNPEPEKDAAKEKSTTHAPKEVELVGEADRAEGGMMLYTSGTTSRPKGVLLHTDVLVAQCRSLVEAWKYSPEDRLLHVLPLHHIHGTVNALLTPLLAGSTIEFMYPFSPDKVWQRFATPFQEFPEKPDEPDDVDSTSTERPPSVLSSVPTLSDDNSKSSPREWSTSSSTASHAPSSPLKRSHSPPPEPKSHRVPITFFTVVPTIWSRLLQTHPTLPPDVQTATKQAIERSSLRLNISGSAALPTPTKSAWTTLSSGNILLERYGMTEVGMALSCGLADEDRIDGSVGWPLPGVEVRLVDPDTQAEIPPPPASPTKDDKTPSGDRMDIDTPSEDLTGEIQLRGPSIFRGYFNNPSATAKDFTSDGWFKTGDIACRRHVPGAGSGASGEWARGPAFFIQGRQSADIIKTGGEKVSALEVERELLSLPEVSECAVVGLPSETWGQKAAAIVVLTEQGRVAGKGGQGWRGMDMRRALRGRLVPYKIPQDLVIVNKLPRNAMGKINKKELVAKIFGDDAAIRRRSVEVREERERLKREEGK